MTPQELEQDVIDAQKAVTAAERDIKDALEWHQRCLIRYAECILAAKKDV